MSVGYLSMEESCCLVQGPEVSVEMARATAVAGHVGTALNQLVSSLGLPAVYFKPQCCFIPTYVGLLCYGLKFFQEIQRTTK